MLDLSDNVYNRRQRRDEPKLKRWRSAGLLLTYRCPARCEHCTYRCGPGRGGLMPVDLAVSAWAALRRLAGTHARVHLTGGEPFVVWGRLLAILEAGRAAGLGPVDMVETNGYWADGAPRVRDRLDQLDRLGVRHLKVSCDPFHQAFVDRERVQCLVATAESHWGPDRVRIRWRDYLETPDGTSRGTAERPAAQTLAAVACRHTGRAADRLAAEGSDMGSLPLLERTCRRAFLAARGVHIDPAGIVFSGTCSGIIIGSVATTPLDVLWCRFDPERVPVVRTLVTEGPAGLLRCAAAAGEPVAGPFGSRCHACTCARETLHRLGWHPEGLGPASCYARGPDVATPGDRHK